MTGSDKQAMTAARDWDSAYRVDARGLPCPQPLLAMRRALRQRSPGELLHVIATDPGSEADFASFSRLSGVPLLRSERRGDEYHYWLQA
ncbi:MULTISPECIES: sulfurtransferase TusA family protein [Microbulbifer]|uniref:Sulfurtransferase TusA family protein n=1 Tax=Microbulbifer celer TaxID=435905 RepID=A0ABW3U3V7_9GAMM|nr:MULTISPECIES: sulfurtransferase TusA family protein [Microbulbifer]UFN56096.1 sulfurtransferase TusA family protein [Microbulbifer celer]